MSYWLPILLTLAVLLLSLLYHLGTFRRRRPGEPPLDHGYLPWLGHVLSFRRNTLQFLDQMQKKHGDIFTLQLGGYYFTFLMDALSYGMVAKISKNKLDFEKFARELVYRVFGYKAGAQDHSLLKTLSGKHLMGDGLVELTQSMMGNLQNLMLQGVEQASQWKEDGLFHFCYNIVFRAGYLSLFGNKSAIGSDEEEAQQHDRQDSNNIFKHFRKYDRLFPGLSYAVLPPRQKLEAERLKRLFWGIFSSQKMTARENISSWISERRRQMVEQGVNAEMQSRYMFLLLWASQGNTGPSAFWLLLHLIRNPKALAAAQAEVHQILRETSQEAKAGSPPINLTRDMLMRTPVLDSAVEETLRLCSGPILIRSVLEDTSLQMADGRQYQLRKGDRLALFPTLSLHLDPEIYPEPHTFRFDRFLQPDGHSKKTEFYKGGKKLKFYTMPWGLGSNLCPGRFFAINEIKQFVFLMLCYFEFELVNPQEEVPPIDHKRWGFGIMQPSYDVQFRYRMKV